MAIDTRQEAPARRITTGAARRPSRWQVLYAVAVGVVVLWTWRELPQYVCSSAYLQDDWEWLRRGASLSRFGEMLLQPTGVVRPVFHSLYALAHALAGLDPRPLAVGLAALWWAAALAGVRMFWLAGCTLPVAVLAVALLLPAEPRTDAFVQISFHGLTVSRLLLILTCSAFLRGEPRTATWAILLGLGFLTHEQYIATAPMLLALLWWRDGGAALWRRLVAPGALRRFCLTFAAVAGVRTVLYLLTERGGTHALYWEHLDENLAALGQTLRRLPPAPALLLVIPLLLGVLRTAPRTLGRLTVVAVALSVAGYAPFAFQGTYFAAYFANLMVFGIALWMASLALAGVDDDLRAGGAGRMVRAGAVVAMTLLWVAHPPTLPARPAASVPEEIRRSLDPIVRDYEGDEAVRVVFVEDAAGLRQVNPPYLASIELGYGQSPYFALLWPELEFEFDRAPAHGPPEPPEAECEVRVRIAEEGDTRWVVRRVEVSGC